MMNVWGQTQWYEAVLRMDPAASYGDLLRCGHQHRTQDEAKPCLKGPEWEIATLTVTGAPAADPGARHR